MATKQLIFWLRQATLVLLCLPAIHLAWRWYTNDLGARPVTEATHVTGDWTVVFLLCSLALTPARSTFDWMPLVQIRQAQAVLRRAFPWREARCLSYNRREITVCLRRESL